MEKISFLITYYNQEQYVKDSMESILALKKPIDYEILIGDDGSIDNTLKIVDGYREKLGDKLKIFQMPREQGIKYNPIHRASANRLNLVSKASGDYIMFLDGDDFYVDCDFLEKALDKFRSNVNLVGCAFNFKYIYYNGSVDFKQNLLSGFVDSDYYLKKSYTPAGAIVFKNIFNKERIKILEECRNFDDNLITIYMLQFGKFYYIDIPIYGYRQTDNSTWNSYSEAEQNLLNAMDYEIISRVAPKFEKLLFKRQYSAIRYIFKNRKYLKNKLTSKYDDLIANNLFVSNMINWNNLSILNKIKILFWFYYKKKV